MMRRPALFAMALLLAALPVSAKRRAVVAGAPGHCRTGILTSAFPEMLAVDADFVYWIDEFQTSLLRVSKNGGRPQRLAFLENWVPLSMTVDDTHVYLGVLPAEALFSPRPGNILAIPKNGGTLSSVVSGVLSPFDVEVDATHVYGSPPAR
jgi:hypothetical protein